MLEGARYFLEEFMGILIIPVDAGVTNIGNLVGCAQVFHDVLTDNLRGDFLVKMTKEAFLGFIHDVLYLFRGDRSFVAGLLYTSYEFVSIIRNPGFIFFNDKKSRAVTGSFIGRKAALAYQT